MTARALAPLLDTPSDLLACRLSRTLAALGWQCNQADIDAAAGTARVELARDDGRLVTLDIDRLGRASITREHRGHASVTVGRRGDRCPVERCTIQFLGRSRYTDAREAVNALAAYVSDNVTDDRLLARGAVAAMLLPSITRVAP